MDLTARDVQSLEAARLYHERGLSQAEVARDKQSDACKNVVNELKNSGLRAISDLRNEKIGFKIREKTLERIPYMLVLGDKEVESGSVNVRTREGDNLGVMTVEEFISLVNAAVSEKGRQNPKTDQE